MRISKTAVPESIVWLEFEQAVELHDAILEHHGGGLKGFPHPAYLDSALHAPQQQLHYEGGGCDLFDLAATYLYHIAKAHAFADGNKRTAYLSALYFLYMNGVVIGPPKNTLTLARATERAARGELDKTTLASIIRRMPRLGQPRIVSRMGGTGEHAANRKRRKGKRQSKKRLL